MPEVRTAVIGCGYWGKNLVRVFSDLRSLAAVCDTDEANLAASRKIHPEVLHSRHIAGILADRDIGAVAIATPAATHFDIARAALWAGKDVFLEKPLALTAKKGQELVSSAAALSRILMVGHILNYHPAVVRLKEIIAAGEIGKINYIYSNRLNLGKFRTEENILWSFAPHDLSALLYLLGEMPSGVTASGASQLNASILDTTLTNLEFPSGVKAHIFVSWLHPFKEQRLVVVGDGRMIVFNDLEPENKLVSYGHRIDWIDRRPVPCPETGRAIPVDGAEPLRIECEHFLDCVGRRKTPRTDGENGLRILRILEACQESLRDGSRLVMLGGAGPPRIFVHDTARVDSGVEIGEGTKIWHYSHLQSGSRIGRDCVLGQNVNIGPNAAIGDRVKIQNNVSVYEGVTLEDEVFCGPSMVFTNISDPRSRYPQADPALYKKTIVRAGASLGANCTILCGHTIGRSAFVGAGAVVTKDVPDFGLVVGNPARLVGWMSEAGRRLVFDTNGLARCDKTGRIYRLENGTVREES